MRSASGTTRCSVLDLGFDGTYRVASVMEDIYTVIQFALQMHTSASLHTTQRQLRITAAERQTHSAHFLALLASGVTSHISSELSEVLP